MPVFLSVYDYEQVLLSLSYYRFCDPPVKLSRFKELTVEQRDLIMVNIQSTPKLVDIISFVLMPNHFHMLLRQVTDDGISNFISRFSNSYTRYFNTKHRRVGSVFQGVFKAVHVETDEQLVHLSRYIHLNPVRSIVIPEKELFSYRWSSLPSYFDNSLSFVNSEPVLSHFASLESYKTFVSDQVSLSKELEKIKHLRLENE